MDLLDAYKLIRLLIPLKVFSGTKLNGRALMTVVGCDVHLGDSAGSRPVFFLHDQRVYRSRKNVVEPLAFVDSTGRVIATVEDRAETIGYITGNRLRAGPSSHCKIIATSEGSAVTLAAAALLLYEY